MDKINVVRETTLTVAKKHLVLVFHYVGSISSETKIKLKKLSKNILNYCKL